MIKYPILYKQIYKKFKHISHNLNLTLNIEQVSKLIIILLINLDIYLHYVIKIILIMILYKII